MKRSVATLAVVIVLSGCGAKSEIRKKALFLCEWDLMSSPDLVSFPDGVKPEAYVRPEDMKVLIQKDKEDSQGLGGVMKAGMLPVIKAVSDARAAETTCDVEDLVIKGNTATVKMKQTSRKLDPADGNPLDRLAQLAKVDGHAAKVAKAKEWLKASKSVDSVEATLHFVKTQDGWRADYQLPEQARANAGTQ